MTFLLVAACILTVAALLDGVSTVRFLKKGFEEIDPVMLWIFQTNKPSALVVYLRGGFVIALEITIAFGLAHVWHIAGIILSLGGLVQAALHTRATILNFKLK